MARAALPALPASGLRFDLQTPWWHLREAAQLAAEFPDTPIILNHTGLPADRSEDGIAGWKRAMATLASRVRTWRSRSPVSASRASRGPWPRTATSCRTTIDLFGVARCMFASNFPVDSLCATFATIFGGFREIVRGLSAAEQRALFHDNAIRIYAMERWSMDRFRIGYVGVGLMGLPMVKRLASLGYRGERVRHRAGAGRCGARCRRARGAARRQMRRAMPISCCSTCRPPTPWSRRCSATKASRPRCEPPQLVIDFSTVEVDAGQARLRRGCATPTGCGWIDAPVSGGPPASGSGTLTVMAGGDAADIARIAPLMADIAARFTHMGPAGSGLVAKMINQLIVGCGHAVMAEALVLAEAAGIDAARIPECLAGGHADGTLLQKLYPRMAARAISRRRAMRGSC